MPGTESDIAAPDQKEELLAYRLEEELKRRLLKSTKTQLIILSTLINIVVTLGLGAALYATARSQLGTEIRSRLDRTFETPRQVVEAKVAGYQRSLDDADRRLSEVDDKLLQVRVDLAIASQDVRGKLSSAERAANKLANDLQLGRLSILQRIEGKKSELDLLDKQLRKVQAKQEAISDQMNKEFERVGDAQSNSNKHEDNLYNKINDVLFYMARLAAKIQASEQMATHIRDGLVNKNLVDLPASISDIEKAELNRIMANSYHTFILEFQTEADLGGLLGRISDALRLHGFNPAGFFTSEKGYDASKKAISREIMGLDNVLESNDACLVVENLGESYVKEAQQAILEAGFPTNCLMEAKINLSERMMSYAEHFRGTDDKDAIRPSKVSIIYVLSKRT